MRRLFALMTLPFLLLAQPVFAQEEAHPLGQKVCALLADYALVARALAEEPQVSITQADAILKRIYLSDNPVIVALETGLRDQARNDNGTPAAAFSNTFLMSCLVHQAQIERLPGLIERKVSDGGAR
jgi:hypothetical protein